MKTTFKLLAKYVTLPSEYCTPSVQYPDGYCKSTDEKQRSWINIILWCQLGKYWGYCITLNAWMPDKSGIWMVQTYPVAKWSGFQMVVWELDQKCPFYCLKCFVFKWSAELCDQTLWKPVKKLSEKANVHISDGYCIA